ncbi:MAG: AbrB/MazE/SpoVT family DNA-binding domain-containing protein [Bacteroidota bacterium]
MQISVVQVGNSKGIRLPKAILSKYNIQNVVELVLEEDFILIKPVQMPRQGWDEAFKTMHENGDDALLIADVFADEKFEE